MIQPTARVRWKGRTDLVGTVLSSQHDLVHVEWDNATPKSSWHNPWDIEVLEDAPPVRKPRVDAKDATYQMLQTVLRDLLEHRVEYTFIGTDLTRTGRLRSVEGRVALITFDNGVTMVASRLDRIRILPEEAAA